MVFLLGFREFRREKTVRLYPVEWSELTNPTSFEIEVFRLPTALPQGQLAEVPLYFEIFTIKVVG